MYSKCRTIQNLTVNLIPGEDFEVETPFIKNGCLTWQSRPSHYVIVSNFLFLTHVI